MSKEVRANSTDLYVTVIEGACQDVYFRCLYDLCTEALTLIAGGLLRTVIHEIPSAALTANTSAKDSRFSTRITPSMELEILVRGEYERDNPTALLNVQ
jgi:hypothetical protein